MRVRPEQLIRALGGILASTTEPASDGGCPRRRTSLCDVRGKRLADDSGEALSFPSRELPGALEKALVKEDGGT